MLISSGSWTQRCQFYLILRYVEEWCSVNSRCINDRAGKWKLVAGWVNVQINLGEISLKTHAIPSNSIQEFSGNYPTAFPDTAIINISTFYRIFEWKLTRLHFLQVLMVLCLVLWSLLVCIAATEIKKPLDLGGQNPP